MSKRSMSHFPLKWSILFPFLILTLTGCLGGSEAQPTQRFTPQPSATFTPRSTELPLVPTPILIGSAEMPIKIAMIGESDAAANRAVRAFTEALNDELDTFSLGYYDGIVVEIELVETEQELLYRLCNSTDTIAFVQSFTFIAAERQCGATPAFQVERDGRSGTNFDLVVFAQRVFSINDLRGRAFCAHALDDQTSFIHPALAFRAVGIDPLDDLTEIVTGYTDDIEMILALTGKYEPGGRPRCDGAAIPDGTFEDIRAALTDSTREQNLTEAQANNFLRLIDSDENVWRQIPYPILVLPPARLIPTYLTERIVAAIEGIEADDSTAKEDLQSLLPHDNLKKVNSSSYNSFRQWITDSGWDMAAPTFD